MNEISKQVQDQVQDQIQDQILTLLQRESIYIASSITSKNHSPPLKHIHNRSKVLKWFYTIVADFQYDREVIPIGMDYLDRFLISDSITKDISTRTYKLVAITSLYLAVKLNIGDSLPRRKICLQEYAYLSEGLISPEDISSMEHCILNTLNWRVHPITPMCFVQYFLKVIEPIHRNEVTSVISGNIASQDETCEYVTMDLCMETLKSIALYFTELAICMPEATAYFHLGKGNHCSIDSRAFAPSTIAYASILLSMEMISHSALPLDTRRSFIHKCEQLCIEKRCSLHPNQKYVKELQIRIQKNFTLDKSLNQAAALDGRTYRCISEIHPVATAIRYGILNSHFLEGISFRHPTDSTETYRNLNNFPMLSRHITSPVPPENPHIPVYTTKRKPSIYGSSPTSLMDKDLSFCNLPAKKRIKQVL